MKQNLPETMQSPETGEILRRDVRPCDVAYKSRTITVEGAELVETYLGRIKFGVYT